MVVLLPLTLLKKHSAEQAMLLTLAVTAFVVLRCVSIAAPLLDSLDTLLERAGLEREYIELLLRTVAASLVTHVCADLCRDGGSQALATLVEVAGTVAVLLVSLPVLEAVAELLVGHLG